MPVGTTRRQDATVFPAAATDAATKGGLNPDTWTLTRLALDGGASLDAMRLLRWQPLMAFLGERWSAEADAIVQGLRAAVRALAADGDACVGYGDAGLLVVARDAGGALIRALDGDFAATQGKRLVGVLGTPDLIEVWRPVAVEDRGFAFEPVTPAADADAPAPEPAPADAPAAPGRVILADATFRYYPLWDVAESTVFCYLCQAEWELGDAVVTEDALGGQFDDARHTLPLDLETFAKATDELDRGLDQYRLANFLIPVHYRTLADPATADTYQRFCNRKVWSVRDFVHFEIVNPPGDVSRDALAAAADLIRPFGAAVLLRLGPGLDGLDRVPADDVLSVGMDLRSDGRPEAEIVADLERLAGAAGEHGFRSHVHGLTAMGLPVAMACTGIGFIGGDGVAVGGDDWQPDAPMARPADFLKTLMARAQGE